MRGRLSSSHVIMVNEKIVSSQGYLRPCQRCGTIVFTYDIKPNVHICCILAPLSTELIYMYLGMVFGLESACMSRIKELGLIE